MKLSYQARKNLSGGAFALPGRRYPIEDASHARNALARVSQFGSSEEKSRVRAAVHSRYPDIGRSTMLQHMHGSGEADRHSYPRTSTNLAQAFHGSKGSDAELERGLPIHGRTGGVAGDDRKTRSDTDLSKSDNFGQGVRQGLGPVHVHAGGSPNAGGSRGSGAQFQYVGAKGRGGSTGPGGTRGSGAQFQYVGARGGQGHGGVGTHTARASSGSQAYSFSGRGPNNMQRFSGSHGTPDSGARSYGTAALGTARRGNTHPARFITPSRTHYVDPKAYRTNFLGTYR